MRVIPTGMQVLGPLSLRDGYILARARALVKHPSVSGFRHASMRKALWAWLGFSRHLDFDRIHPATRSHEEAGLTTPSSARRHKKKTRGGRG